MIQSSSRTQVLGYPCLATGDTLYIDEVLVKINGKQHYPRRAVDQDGEVIDVYLQAKRDAEAAKLPFKRLLPHHSGEPRKVVTAHAAAHNLFNLGRYLIRIEQYRDLRVSAFE